MKSARMDGDFGVGPEGRGERTPSLPPPPPPPPFLKADKEGTAPARGRTSERGELGSEWNPVERSGVHTGVCRVPDPRPSPYTLHRGPVDGGPVHRKIRPPGASRRRATDNHVTLLLYRYRSRRHNTAPRTVPPRRYAPLGRREKGGGGRGKRGRTKEEIILYFSYEPVRYLPSSVHSAEHWVSSSAETAARLEADGGGSSRLWGCESRLHFFLVFCFFHR